MNHAEGSFLLGEDRFLRVAEELVEFVVGVLDAGKRSR